MIRRTALLLACIAFTLPAAAAKRVTVAEFEQAIAALQGRADADIAWQIANLQLTERLSTESSIALAASLPGEQSKQTVQAIADEAAFLDPPAAELPSQPAPDLAQQRRIMGLVVGYVRNTIPQLPNFFATRDTTRYEDTPQLQSPNSYVPYQPLHFVDHSQATVLYRDGREAADTGGKKGTAAPSGLTTWGVFGPILSTVLLDAAQNTLAWSHWERGPAGPVAVFRYAVPKEKSHYEVNYCCVAHQTATEVAHLVPFRQLTGYHGEMSVDPATGAILRLTSDAELKPTDPVVEAKILVEYGQVEIGGKSYLCPMRSVSTTHAQTLQFDPVYKFPLARQLQPLKEAVSDVVFGRYHMFRADARVLTQSEARLASMPAANSAAEAGFAATQNEISSTVTTPAPPATPASTMLAPSLEPAIPEMQVNPTASLPEMATEPAAPGTAAGFTLRTTTRLVDVSVVAYERKGHPVTGLKAEDFEVYDNGRKQEIRFFGQANPGAASAPIGEQAETTVDSGVETYTNRVSAALDAAADAHSTILMIDAANVAFGDLTRAQREMLRFLKTVPAEEPIGLYILRSYGFEILSEPTLDHAHIEATLKGWMPSAQDLAHAQDKERRNRQQIDWVHRATDLANVNGNGQAGNDPEMYASGKEAAQDEASPLDAELRPLGDRPEDFALHLLVGVGRHLAAIPGHKMLVWISSDNVLADFSAQAVGREDSGNRFLDQPSLRARETLNEAHVSIYPLDASQLEAGGVGADLGNRNVLAIGKSDRDPAIKLGDATPGMKPGRAAAQMQQDTHPIQGIFRDLADATGGRALRRAGDLAGELDNVVADGRATYLLSFSPDMPADDRYHTITLKLVARHDLTLRFRNGYLYSNEPASMKDRFRQAAWQPRDVNGIMMTATLAPDAKGTSLKLAIDATDLALVQKAGRWSDRIDIFLVLRDDAGLHAQVTGHSLGLQMLPGTYQQAMKDGIPFEQPIAAKTPFDSARMIVIDENSGRIGTVTIPANALHPTH